MKTTRREPVFQNKIRPLLIGLLLILCTAGCLDQRTADDDPTAGPLPGSAHSEDYAMDWEQVEALKNEQKYEAAAELVAGIRADASEANHQETWTRALIEEALLRTALHGYETAVRFLMDEPWPADPMWRAVLDLHYANALVVYHGMYGYEIRGRERVAGDETVDLKAWTSEQIVGQTHAAFGRVWAGRGDWGARSLGQLSVYIDQNDYPARIRGTLRDAVTYMWANLLGDRALWSPRHENEVFLLDTAALIRGTDGTALDPADPAIHPLRRLAAVLADLQDWHADDDRDEAALEARLDRLRLLYAALEPAPDRQAIIDDLSAELDRFDAAYDWWSMGQWQLAEFLRAGPADEPKMEAHRAAVAGRDRHPESPGGRRCAHMVETIEAPVYELEAMATDAARERSIRISHRNAERLHFRAWRFDLAEYVEGAERHAHPWPDNERIADWVDRREPDLTWSVDLPPTPDFESHATYTSLPADRKGAYIVAASLRRDFRESANSLRAVNMLVSDLVVTTRETGNTLELCARSGVTGDPVAGATGELRHFTSGRHDTRLEILETDAQGLARIVIPRRHANLRLFAHKGEDLAYIGNIWARQPRAARDLTRSFVYTDRSVYRPGQVLHWKVVAYRGGATPAYQTLPETKVLVSLRDANNREVVSETLRTNAFGSVSGSFVVPRGRVLGSWSLHTSLDGHARVKVEEYKRPTFEVSLDDPETPLRLNRPVTLVGRADYYFGLPVATGDAVWRITREPRWPRWWWWHPPASPPQTVAAGRTQLDGNGTFEVTFTPRADEREGGEDVSYAYRLTADVTDEGGETRQAARAFRLGFVSVDAVVEAEAGFVRPGETCALSVTRTDLDGTPRPGEGTWRLVALEQPERALLPAEQPVRFAPGETDPHRTAGDSLQPRWQALPRDERATAHWPDGREIDRGTLTHGENGVGRIEADDLAAGAYRLHYETTDDFGAARRVRHDFVVAGRRSTPLSLPLVLKLERASVAVGDTARLLLRSGLTDQEIVLELTWDGLRRERRVLRSGRDDELIEIPVTSGMRGGLQVQASALRDHQALRVSKRIHVPWDDRRLEVDFATFRDRLRPGAGETFRVTVRDAEGRPDPRLAAEGVSELLAYMYDRSLDIFAPHRPPSPISLFPTHARPMQISDSLGRARTLWRREKGLGARTEFPHFKNDSLRAIGGHAIGGMGLRMREGELYVRGGRKGAVMSMDMAAPMAAKAEEVAYADSMVDVDNLTESAPEPAPAATEPVEPRTNFAETAFFVPHLLLDEDGAAVIEFEVPDSVTEWNVWVHALTRDLRSGSAHRTTASVKELMVRPYLPRFLREGDRAELKVVVNNAGETELSGRLDFELLDPDTEADLRGDFGLDAAATEGVPFTVEAGGGTDLSFPIATPARVGPVVCRVTARAGDFADGEQRALPVLPGRMHLMQSRFASLREGERRELRFADLADDDDPTRIDEQLVVTVDAQLFYSALSALPYLVDYPYDCSEQLLNRFLSTGILTSLFDRYPSVATMARELAKRETRLEAWESDDPNRKLLLEETPWLQRAEGGRETGYGLIKVLDPEIARATRETALAKLIQAQAPSGGFSWWPGGRTTASMTLYVLYGFAKGLEFGVDAPRDVIARAWRFMREDEYDAKIRACMEDGRCKEIVTFLNYVLSCYPDTNWTGGVFTDDDRDRMLDYSFAHWRELAPLMKGYLSLTLARAGRDDDATLVFDSIMDSAKTEPDLGTYWAPEDRAWLWYNDTIETHAFALRAMTELAPDDARRHGLVQWLLLNKKLNHWSSTRRTAEVIYALIHYLEHEGALGATETVDVAVGPLAREFVFAPDAYTGGRNRVIVPGDELDPRTMSTVVAEKGGQGTAFVSATWHFSTERMPTAADGDLFAVERSYFRRHNDGDEWVLSPLRDGDRLDVGDQLEVQLSVHARHAAHYVHLRDPRGAGFEPESTRSGHRWDQGLGYYEEIRDSGANFFFSSLRAGQYTLRYRLRANMAGEFKAGPAVLQSMYAPEFTAYSAGHILQVE